MVYFIYGGCMRILIFLKDENYCKALCRKITGSREEIILLVKVDNFKEEEQFDVAITDYEFYEFSNKFKLKNFDKWVFLVKNIEEDNVNDCKTDINKLFKYKGFRYLITDLMWFYYRYNEITEVHKGNGVMVTVFSDDNVKQCGKYAKKIGDRLSSGTKNKVLIVPLKYIDLESKEELNFNYSFKRFMYYVNTNKAIEPESFFFNDIHGIYRIKNNEIFNPLIDIRPDDFEHFLDVLINNIFDVIIFDIGNCLNKNNLNLIKISDFRIIIYERKNLRLIKNLKNKCKLGDEEIIEKIESGDETVKTYDTNKIIEKIMKKAIYYDKKF